MEVTRAETAFQGEEALPNLLILRDTPAVIIEKQDCIPHMTYPILTSFALTRENLRVYLI
jgi:hypothetical protein